MSHALLLNDSLKAGISISTILPMSPILRNAITLVARQAATKPGCSDPTPAKKYCIAGKSRHEFGRDSADEIALFSTIAALLILVMWLSHLDTQIKTLEKRRGARKLGPWWCPGETRKVDDQAGASGS
jgi:hypothetical protein